MDERGDEVGMKVEEEQSSSSSSSSSRRAEAGGGGGKWVSMAGPRADLPKPLPVSE